MCATKISPFFSYGFIVLLLNTRVQSMFFKRPPATITLEDIHPANGAIRFDSEDIDYYENINPHCRTIFLIHGWYPDQYNAFDKSYEELLAKEKCCNVVNVLWRFEDDTDGYYEAAKRIPAVAAHVAEHIVELHQFGLLQHLVEIVGHSMGAHIAGTAARIANRRGRVVDVLLALDPCGPGFTDYDLTYAKYKLTSKDASRVISLYTNQNYLGSSEPTGDVVFFANDGSNQPGCDLDIWCDHRRAIDYYNESLNNHKYVAYDRSGNQATFQSLNHEAPGHYYFSTRNLHITTQAPQQKPDNFNSFKKEPKNTKPDSTPNDFQFMLNHINKYNNREDLHEKTEPVKANVDTSLDSMDFMFSRLNKHNNYQDTRKKDEPKENKIDTSMDSMDFLFTRFNKYNKLYNK
ncbi:pancreatic triacylglycerol lipase-like [Atheta coriaria]|uniref:pancreatic triacylglycerol lipase-like n=1 Tax=Dalotia coriaria TaxID=877792 RepID=UPI0031F40D84